MCTVAADLWSPGWVPPLTVSPHTADAYHDVQLLRTLPPVFGLEQWWGWQEHTLALLLSRDASGLPTYATVVVIICRQNGKTTLLYVAAWVWLTAGLLVSFTSHERQKAREKWEEVVVALMTVSPRRYRVSRRPGSERLTDLRTGGRFDLVTPDDAGGRSDTYDVVVVDEAAHISPRYLRAAQATMLTRPDAQVVLISSAGHEESEDLDRAREAAVAQQPLPIEARSSGIIEFSAKDTAGLGNIDVRDESIWERCIPTLDLPGGARREALRTAVDALSAPVFAREFLGVRSGSPESAPITRDIWTRALADQMPPWDQLTNVVVAADCDPDQTSGAVAVAAVHTATGQMWAALAAHDSGTSWIEGDTLALARRRRARKTVIDAATPAAAMAARLDRGGARVDLTSAQEMARSCAALVTMLHGRSISIVADDALTAAATGASRRPIADAGWAFRRRTNSVLDITPIVAVALAAAAARNLPAPRIRQAA